MEEKRCILVGQRSGKTLAVVEEHVRAQLREDWKAVERELDLDADYIYGPEMKAFIEKWIDPS